MNPFILCILGILAAFSAYLPWRGIRWIQMSSFLLGVAMNAMAIRLALQIFGGVPIEGTMWIRDELSAFMLILIAVVALGSMVVSLRYITIEHEEKVISTAQVRMYYALLNIFVLAMMLVVLANNIFLLWIALEATTLSTTLLVCFYVRDAAVEAAWKYIILCSTGIALGLVGLLILGQAAIGTGLAPEEAFLLSALTAQATSLPAIPIQWAFVFLMVGFGTKVGFAPLHTWLPDAHSKAPAPISALFSGVLLNVALVALLRFKFITDLALHSSAWTNGFFLVFSVLSVGIPAFILIVQRNYKRMLAYSSIEHMGLLAFSVTLGPAGALASVLHMLGHALAKSLLFFGAGEILLRYHSTKFKNIRSLARVSPPTAVLFLLGILAILAVPLSPLFLSEFSMLSLGMDRYRTVTLIMLLFLVMICVAMLRHTIGMFFSSGETVMQKKSSPQRCMWNLTHSVMAIELVILVIAGFLALSPQGLALGQAIAAHFSIPYIP